MMGEQASPAYPSSSNLNNIQLNFNELLSVNEFDENDPQVIKNKNVFSTSYSHLNKYQVSYAIKPLINLNECEKIGNGRFGEVFKAKVLQNRYTAFKRIKLIGEKVRDNKLMREIRTHKLLDHKNVVNFY
jgi:Protein kinase domain